ncbi:hypothetical protein K431DRAFT_225636 [Polychaeton citri CBS 116435]|uniref:Shugoshin C-terminal domain-containing protein n=1 Tax=Polychaeton citri CBS 116435 TaxID=1314669 RepID=A0A9P4Q7Q7_9PEZI|nr:hypothetical protein K431DRAFT_225636 [Polychaeton citri CBS 116435]
MARLNEPPAVPASAAISSTSENIDALKRRFIRQNRELARCNSNQSLRIRTLENDVSRLLQDNLELREQILVVQNELHEARNGGWAAGASKVKDELQAKLAELGALVEGLDTPGPSHLQERPNILKDRAWPFEAQIRERQSLAALMHDVQMPTIEEDGTHSRLTLGHDKMQHIRLSDGSTNSNESPEIGPPPIARFDCGDSAPIKFEAPTDDIVLASPEKKSDTMAEIGAEDELPSGLAINLETRRKRKDGQPRTERRRTSILPASPAKRQEELPPTLRTGAKRKLADRDTERPIKPPSRGDFTFSRRRPSTPSVEDALPGDAVPVKPEETAETPQQTSPQKPPRKVLGDRDVNISPRKPAAREKGSKDSTRKPPATKPPTARERQQSRRATMSSIPLPSPKQEEAPKIVEISLPAVDESIATKLPPETPATAAALGSLPPPASEPPPVTKLQSFRSETPSMQPDIQRDCDAGGRRPSRRRSEVNYAEPSLVTKMRRSDKRLTDAITYQQGAKIE